MSTFTADEAFLKTLSQMRDVTEIRDAHGNLRGIYTPVGKTDEDIKKMFDLEKAREILAREKHLARPLRDIIAKLEGMAEKRG